MVPAVELRHLLTVGPALVRSPLTHRRRVGTGVPLNISPGRNWSTSPSSACSFLAPPPFLGQGLAASCRVSLALFKKERPNREVGARGPAIGLSRDYAGTAQSNSFSS